MNWFIVTVNFLILLGISIYFGNKKDFQLKDGYFWLSGLTVLLSPEMLVFLLWLGNVKSIITWEISMLLSFGFAFFLSHSEKSASNLLSQKILKREDAVMHFIYLLVYLMIKLVLVLLASIYLLRIFLNWSSISALVIVIMMVSAYRVLGNFKSLVVTQIFQVILIVGSAVTLIIIPSQNTLAQNDIIANINPVDYWKILVVGIFYWGFQWIYEQQLFQRFSTASPKKGFSFSIIILIAFTFLILFPARMEAMNQNIFIKIGILSIIMAALANISNSIARLVIEDFYQNIKSKENVWEGDLISKIIVTGLAFISVLLVLVMKNATLTQVMVFWEFWLVFAIITMIMALFSSFMLLNLPTVMAVYFLGFGFLLLPLISELKMIDRFSQHNIFDRTLMVSGFVVFILFTNYLIYMIKNRGEKSSNIFAVKHSKLGGEEK